MCSVLNADLGDKFVPQYILRSRTVDGTTKTSKAKRGASRMLPYKKPSGKRQMTSAFPQSDSSFSDDSSSTSNETDDSLLTNDQHSHPSVSEDCSISSSEDLFEMQDQLREELRTTREELERIQLSLKSSEEELISVRAQFQTQLSVLQKDLQHFKDRGDVVTRELNEYKAKENERNRLLEERRLLSAGAHHRRFDRATCPVCLDPIGTWTSMEAFRPCGHGLCGPCCQTILRGRKRTCPVCRARTNGSSMVFLT